MSISNNDLLNVIWQNQILLTSERVVQFMGTRFFMQNSVQLCCVQGIIDFPMVQDGSITSSKLKNRIRLLNQEGVLDTNHGRKLMSFHVPGDTAEQMLEDARRFWFDNNFSSQMQISEKGLLRLQGECYDLLMSRYASKAPEMPLMAF